MAAESVLYRVEEGVAWITLNRPERLNAFNDQQLHELERALRQAEKAPEVGALVLTGAGRAFCSGQDLAAIGERYGEDGEQPAVSFREHLESHYHPLIRRMRRMEKPILAAIHGVAAGAGLSLALSCDLRIASTEARLIAVFIRVALLPDSGASFWLPRLLGPGTAFELAALGDEVGAAEAQRLGLVNRVVAPEELQAAAGEWAGRLARGPLRSLGYLKRLLNHSLAHSLEETLAYEAAMQELAGRTQDHREAVRAFLEKRAPQFRGL